MAHAAVSGESTFEARQGRQREYNIRIYNRNRLNLAPVKKMIDEFIGLSTVVYLITIKKHKLMQRIQQFNLAYNNLDMNRSNTVAIYSAAEKFAYSGQTLCTIFL